VGSREVVSGLADGQAKRRHHYRVEAK